MKTILLRVCRTFRENGERCVAVQLTHLSCFGRPILTIVLNNARGIDSKVLEPRSRQTCTASLKVLEDAFSLIDSQYWRSVARVVSTGLCPPQEWLSATYCSDSSWLMWSLIL